MSEYIHKSHNVSVLLYHIVCPAKYRRIVINEAVDKTQKAVCEEISKRYEIQYLEIGTDEDHVHFLVQSVPAYRSTKIVTTIKSIIAREIFSKHPEVKKKLRGRRILDRRTFHKHGKQTWKRVRDNKLCQITRYRRTLQTTEQDNRRFTAIFHLTNFQTKILKYPPLGVGIFYYQKSRDDYWAKRSPDTSKTVEPTHTNLYKSINS
jgi:REP element-mobilizing transposase RayT